MPITPISADHHTFLTPNWRLEKCSTEPSRLALTAEQQAVCDHTSGSLLVLAGPGTGKSETLVEAVAARLASGVLADEILVIGFSHESASDIKSKLIQITGGGALPTVSTFHSIAFGWAQEFAEVDQMPTLITASAQEVILKELMLDIAADGVLSSRLSWPKELLPALGTKAFLIEIRNIIARAQSLGLLPQDFQQMVMADSNWQPIAQLYRDYVQVLIDRDLLDYNQLILHTRELVQQESVQTRLQQRYSAIFIDEYQDVDPLQIEILSSILGSNSSLVAFADPDQAVYSFRGAQDNAVAKFKLNFGSTTNAAKVLSFSQSFRLNSEIGLATARVIDRNANFHETSQLSTNHRKLNFVDSPNVGAAALQVNHYESAETEAAAIAEEIRALVLAADSGLSWTDVAVLVRTGAVSIPAIEQALVAADIPVQVVFDEVPLAQEKSVKVLLDALELVHSPSKMKDPFTARSLLTSPLGGFSPTDLRALGRELKRSLPKNEFRFSEQLIADALADLDFAITVSDSKARDLLVRVRQLHELIYSAHRSHTNGSLVAEALWTLWSSPIHDWSNQLRRRAMSNGYAAAIANHSLDAVRSLFKIASDPASAVHSQSYIPNFLYEIRKMEVSSQKPLTALTPNAVQIMTAHRAKGKQWPVVFVASVDEGRWPDVSRRSSLFSADRLTEEELGHVPERHEVVSQERRLFYTACTRATQYLRVSSTSLDRDSGRVPSRFLNQLSGEAVNLDVYKSAVDSDGGASTAYSLTRLVAQLRRTAISVESSEALKAAALERLIKLSNLRDSTDRLIAPSAHPAAWWGIAEVSENSAPVVPASDAVYVRGSSFQDLLNCPLNWFMKQKAMADVGGSAAANFGSVVHAIAAGIIEGEVTPSDAEIRRILDSRWGALRYGSDWESAAQKEAAVSCVESFIGWRQKRLGELQSVEIDGQIQPAEFAETAFNRVVDFPMPDGSVEKIKLTGSIDILQIEADGRVFIADIKTSTAATRAKDTEVNPQLGVYQKAVQVGLVDAVPAGSELAGAALLFVRDTLTGNAPTIRTQPGLNLDEAGEDWMSDNFRRAIEVVRSENHTPIVSDSCQYCPIKSSCPTQAVGKSVI